MTEPDADLRIRELEAEVEMCRERVVEEEEGENTDFEMLKEYQTDLEMKKEELEQARSQEKLFVNTFKR